MKEEKQIGSLWNLSFPLKAINESGIRLKTDVWAIYFVIKPAIEAKWSHKEKDDSGEYAWVSNKYIKSQLQSLPDVADVSDNALYRKIKQLEEVGLLVRMKDNHKKNRCYLAVGPSDDSLVYGPPHEKTQGDPLQNCNTPIAKTQRDNNTNDNRIKDNIPPTPLDGVSEETPPKPKREPSVKKKLTRKETNEFYENESRVALEIPLPADILAAAAARGIPQERIAARYRELVDYMMKPSEAWPNGMWGCVLTKPNQLSFEQFARLVFIKGMSSDGINDYLNQWENKSYDNNNIYATFCGWWAKEKAKPANGHSNEPPKRGLSIPKTVTQ